jgi:hypothetical protein
LFFYEFNRKDESLAAFASAYFALAFTLAASTINATAIGFALILAAAFGDFMAAVDWASVVRAAAATDETDGENYECSKEFIHISLLDEVFSMVLIGNEQTTYKKTTQKTH